MKKNSANNTMMMCMYMYLCMCSFCAVDNLMCSPGNVRA